MIMLFDDDYDDDDEVIALNNFGSNFKRGKKMKRRNEQRAK